MEALSPRRIALVTSRYGELQGLLTASEAVFPLYMGAVMILATRLDDTDVSMWFIVPLGMPLLVFGVAQVRWIQPRILAYYSQRFGRWHWLPAVFVAVLMPPDMALRPSYHAALQHVGGWGLAVGAALAFAGWFDHRLLVRTLTASLCDIAAGEPTR